MHDFMPPGLVTGIGSLPHVDAEAAVRCVAQVCPTLPFWPQLPQRSASETVIAQMLGPLLDLVTPASLGRLDIRRGALPEFRRRLRVTSAALDATSAAGFFAFERAGLDGAFLDALAIKGQMTGPITLAHCLFVDGIPLAARPAVHNELTDYLCDLAAWQVARLRRLGRPVLIFVDEAALGLGRTAPYLAASLRRVLATLRAAGAYTGSHCCAANIPPSVCTLRPDIVSFDAYAGLEAFVADPHVQTFIDEGGWLALGMTPTLINLNDAWSRPPVAWACWMSPASSCPSPSVRPSRA